MRRFVPSLLPTARGAALALLLLAGMHADAATVSPANVWAIGGEVVRIEGEGLVMPDGYGAEVYIDGMPAAYAPGYPITDTAVYVIAPPLDRPGSTESTVAVPVDVQTADGGWDTREAALTYRRHATVASANGPVHAAAFAFDPGAGSGWQPVPLPGGGVARVRVPAFDGGAASRVGCLVRVAREEAATGGAWVYEGVPAPGAWSVAVHFYELAYPHGELLPAFDIHDAAIEVDLPGTGADGSPLLTAGTLRGGGVAAWRVPVAYDYAGGPDTVPAPLTGETGVLPIRYQWNVGPNDLTPPVTPGTPDAAAVQRVRFRLDGPGAAVLRLASPVPRALVRATAYTLAPGSPSSGPAAGGTEVVIRGRGLAWPERVAFGEVTAYRKSAGAEVTFASDTELRLRTPAVELEEGESRTVPIEVTLPQGSQRSGASVVLAKQFTFDNAGGLLLSALTALLAVPIALLGLFAGGNSGGGTGGPCFIATAAYGTPLAEGVEVLRAFRDAFLLPNPAGAAFVDAYYRLSPPVAEVVAAHPVLAVLVRALLWPVVAFARMTLAYPAAAAAVVLLPVLWRVTRRRPDMKRRRG
jgi:hypothetical protein